MLRVSDQSIAARYLSIYHDITGRRLTGFLHFYQTLLDEADDIQHSKDVVLASDWCDFIPEPTEPILVKVGVTPLNIRERRYSVI